jgi:hypothetical protein
MLVRFLEYKYRVKSSIPYFRLRTLEGSNRCVLHLLLVIPSSCTYNSRGDFIPKWCLSAAWAHYHGGSSITWINKVRGTSRRLANYLCSYLSASKNVVGAWSSSSKDWVYVGYRKRLKYLVRYIGDYLSAIRVYQEELRSMSNVKPSEQSLLAPLPERKIITYTCPVCKSIKRYSKDAYTFFEGELLCLRCYKKHGL